MAPPNHAVLVLPKPRERQLISIHYVENGLGDHKNFSTSFKLQNWLMKLRSGREESET